MRAGPDLDDADALIDADRDGLLRGASMAGAQVRAVAAAVAEGALEPIAGADRPRSLIWVCGRGPAASAGAMLAAVLNPVAAQPITVVAEAPRWIGPLDLLVVAGDDPEDPALVSAVGAGTRRGARVVVAAPMAGPLREAAAGRAADLSPRVSVPDAFGVTRFLAVGLAVGAAVGLAVGAPDSLDLNALADELDAEALRNSAGRELFTNAAKLLAQRISSRAVVLAGDNAATLALARHAGEVLLRVGRQVVAAAPLADALTALRDGLGGDAVADLFHDEELDGPLPGRPLVLTPTLAAEHAVVAARTAPFADVDLLASADVPSGADGPAAAGADRVEQQLAVLAVRLEMAAAYLGLLGGERR
ncbi:hypothetical protein MBRU_08040 [Mycolicibacterium brumae DSM 44177]|nr:hypothetical protein MBRU_08040 [Mycolicibacterium brumae DSM 44177]